MIAKLPFTASKRIAEGAVNIAQMIAPRKTGKGAVSLRPIFGEGMVGIEIPDEVSYMYYQDRGIQRHGLHSLSDKTIPIRTSSGEIIFRRARKEVIGQKRIITRLPEDGQIAQSSSHWTYPRQESTDFLGKSLELSLQKFSRGLDDDQIVDILSQTEYADDLQQFLRGY